MTQPPIHAKSQERERFEVLERAARVFAGRGANDSRFVLSDRGDGKLFALDLAPGDVEVAAVSGPLILGALDGDKYAADRAAPVRKVRKQFGNLQQFVTTTDLSKLVRPLGGAAGAQPVRANPKTASPAYACRLWALDASVPNEVLENADHDLGSALGAFVRDTWLLAREYEVAQVLTTPGNWAANNQITPSGGNLWSTTNGKPIDDLFAALQASKNPRPNLFVMSEQVARYWYSNAVVQSFYMTGALEELHLEIITVGAKVASQTAASGQVDVWAAVGNHAVLLRTGPADGTAAITTAATPRWKGDEIRGVPQGEAWVMIDDVLMRTFWEPRIGARGLSGCVLAVNETITMIDNTLGAIIKSVA